MRTPGRPPRLVALLGALACAACLPPVADTPPPTDPFHARVRGLTDVPYPSFQGAECVTIEARRDLVYRLLVAPEGAALWLLADLENVVPRRARYRTGPTATRGDVLLLEADTLEGPRRAELTVLAEVPDQLLALLVTKDDEIISRGAERLTFTFVLEDGGDGTTDLWWAVHSDPDSPLTAAVSSLGGPKRRARLQRGLLTFRGMAEAAARLSYPPLHEIPRPAETRRK